MYASQLNNPPRGGRRLLMEGLEGLGEPLPASETAPARRRLQRSLLAEKEKAECGFSNLLGILTDRWGVYFIACCRRLCLLRRQLCTELLSVARL